MLLLAQGDQVSCSLGPPRSKGPGGGPGWGRCGQRCRSKGLPEISPLQSIGCAASPAQGGARNSRPKPSIGLGFARALHRCRSRILPTPSARRSRVDAIFRPKQFKIDSGPDAAVPKASVHSSGGGSRRSPGYETCYRRIQPPVPCLAGQGATCRACPCSGWPTCG
jgi:hypothetical protein